MSTLSPSSTRGLSSRGTLLLAIIGAGLAASLFFLFQSSSTSRAAAPRRPRNEPLQERASTKETVGLVQPLGIETGAQEPEVAAVVPAAAAEAPATAAQAQALAAAEGRPKVEGPPLRRIKESNVKADSVDHHELRQSNRDRRKQRKEEAVLNERAFGTDEPQDGESAKPRARAKADRNRLGKSGGAGPRQGQGKRPRDGG